MEVEEFPKILAALPCLGCDIRVDPGSLTRSCWDRTQRPTGLTKFLKRVHKASCFDVRWCGGVLDLILLFSFGLQACAAADEGPSVELIVDLTLSFNLVGRGCICSSVLILF